MISTICELILCVLAALILVGCFVLTMSKRVKEDDEKRSYDAMWKGSPNDVT